MKKPAEVKKQRGLIEGIDENLSIQVARNKVGVLASIHSELEIVKRR